MGSVTVVLAFLFLSVLSDACPRLSHPLSCGKCVITAAQTVQLQATSACSSDYNNGELLTVTTADELRVVRQYVAELGGNNADFWVGYTYSGSELRRASDNTTAPPLVSNEVTLGQGNDNCLVIMKNGSFEGRSCSGMWRSLCLFDFTSPSPSISVTPSPITAGSTVTITCMFNSLTEPGTISFLRGGDPVSFGSVTSTSSSAVLTISSFSARMNGAYECRTSVGAETGVSRVVDLTVGSSIPSESGVDATLNGSPVSNPTEIQFGTTLTLSCSFTGSTLSSQVEWFINGFISTTNVTTEADRSSSTLYLAAVSTTGVYQCRIKNADGTSRVGSIVLCGNLTETTAPGPVNIFAIPFSKTSLSINLIPPGNTIDYLLTRTSIFYHTSRYTNYNDASAVHDLVIDSSATGRGFHELSGLTPGTRYYIAAQASNLMGMVGEEAPFITVVDTFGNPPTTPPSRLTLRVTPDGMTLLADWEDVVTVRPFGPLAFYNVQFSSSRDDRGVVNTLRIDPGFSFSVISGVTDGNFYRVRVQSAVQVLANPIKFEYSPFTDNVNVSGIVLPSNVPSTPPTFTTATVPILPQEAVVAISVVVPIVVIGVAVAVIAFVIILLITRSHSSSVQPDGGEMKDLKKGVKEGEETKPHEE